MSQESPQRDWDVFARTVRGAAHVRSGLPNQDACRWQFSFGDSGATLILCIADGHGSKKSFRSDKGAQLAVQTAVELIQEFEKGLGQERKLSEIERVAEIDLPRKIVQQWQDTVTFHLQGHPLRVEELDQLEPQERTTVQQERFLVYGATLLSVLVTQRFLLYLQLGDGDILVISDNGEVSRPLPPDDRLFANETVSLCSPGSSGSRRHPSAGPAGAWSEFRIRFQPVEQMLPALILLSTDGYANSFRTDADFLKVGSDILATMRDEGPDYVKSNLESWLLEASQAGSGDDVTVGLVYRVDGIPSSGSEAKDRSETMPQNRTSWLP